MPSYAKAILIGNLVRDPELRYLPNQTPVCSFTLACNHVYTKDGEKREEVAFIDCTAWGKAGETINQYVKKGQPLMVDGRIRQENWTDKESGAKRSKLSVTVDAFQFLGGKRDDEQPERSGQAAPSRPAKPPAEDPFVGQPAGGPFVDEDIPFAPNKY